MVEFLAQNFNWPTFFLALGFFVLVSNFYALALAIFNKRRADKAVAKVEKKYDQLREQLRQKDKELSQMLGKGEK